MSNRASNYETLYGVGLLDDLHNYFPALLYDSDSFRTVQDVLQYISLQTRRRFDLYSFGLSSYEDANSGRAEASRASVGAGNSTFESHQFYQQPLNNRTSQPIPTSPPLVATPPTQSPVQQTMGRAATTSTTNAERLYRYVIDLGDEQFDIGEHNFPGVNSVMSPTMLTSLLAGVVPRMRTNNRVDELSAVANLLLRMGGAATMPAMEPVVVRPTHEQIARATEVAVPTTEQDCAICQDSIATTQECRKILHCGHWFHKDCIDPWFRQNVQCPICRYDIREYRTGEDQQGPASEAHTRDSYPEEDYH